MRSNKLIPEGLGNQAWHVQFTNMISVMISHNQHLAGQLKWALGIIIALDSRGITMIDYTKELTWPRYI
jgi:hypothetical protein